MNALALFALSLVSLHAMVHCAPDSASSFMATTVRNAVSSLSNSCTLRAKVNDHEAVFLISLQTIDKVCVFFGVYGREDCVRLRVLRVREGAECAAN